MAYDASHLVLEDDANLLRAVILTGTLFRPAPLVFNSAFDRASAGSGQPKVANLVAVFLLCQLRYWKLQENLAFT